MSILKEMKAIKEIENIENNKSFQRLSEKTQVLVPMTGRNEIVKNRLTHSYEVATSASNIMLNIALKNKLSSINDLDYQNSVKQICMLHDIGHPPFGHDGAKIIDSFFKEKGLAEGFSDNNNNLVIMEKQRINVRDYVKAGIIKYPEKLYDEQKKIYLPILDKAINEDKEHYESIGIKLGNIKTTISGQIMDEADRNSYTCSDLSDFYCLGTKIKINQIENIFNMDSEKQFLIVKRMINEINSGSKNRIKNFFYFMKNSFNENINISENGLYFIDEDLFQIRESFSKMEYELFIKPVRSEKFHINNEKKLKNFINEVFNNNWIQSSFYKEKINNTSDPIEKLILQRDMISEVSDWFVINFDKKYKKKNKIKPK